MAKGRGGKGQSTATANGPQHKKAGDREDQQHTQVKGQRNRIRNKKDVIVSYDLFLFLMLNLPFTFINSNLAC